MAAEKAKKTEKKELEAYRPTRWLSPFERMDEMFDEFVRKPFGRPFLSHFPRIMEEKRHRRQLIFLRKKTISF